MFDKTTGEYLGRFGGKGDEDEHLDKPEGIAVDDSGNIFVADYNTGYVKVYDKDHNWVMTFSDYGDAPGENIKSEFMAIHDGLLYMPEAGNHRVNVFDLEGNFIALFGEGGNTEPDSAEGLLNNPEAAKVNGEGRVYVSDLKNDRVQVFDLDGNFLFGWGKTGSGPGEFIAPRRIGHRQGRQRLYRRNRQQPRPGLRQDGKIPHHVGNQGHRERSIW